MLFEIPKILVEKVSKIISVPRGHLNLERSQMPQISRDNLDDFINFLKLRRIPISSVKIPVANLKATQKEFDYEKVRKMINEPPNKPILVSNDNFVLDGHHIWLAIYTKDRNGYVDAILIGQPIDELLRTARMYPNVFSKTIKGE